MIYRNSSEIITFEKFSFLVFTCKINRLFLKSQFLKKCSNFAFYRQKTLHLTVHVRTFGIQIKIGMLLAVVLDLIESITAIIWYTFLCKKDSTITINDGAPHLIFNHWFKAQFLLISFIFYSNVMYLSLIYPIHHILPDKTSKICIKNN